MAEPITPVVLGGGAGTRLWPLSRRGRPKQFLAGLSGRSLFHDTLQRFAGPDAFSAPIIVCGEEHRFLVAGEVQAAGIDARIMLEPAARDTALAVAVAALYCAAREPDCLMLISPSDHAIAEPEVLLAAIEGARDIAMGGALVTFGIPPTRPETAFGYLETEQPAIAGEPVPAVRFVEKPNATRAKAFFMSGRHLWNSGLFLFRASVLIEEMERHAPEILQAARISMSNASDETDFLRLGADGYGLALARSLDHAVFESSGKVVVMPVGDAGWEDLGSWASYRARAIADQSGNAATGEAVLSDSRACFVHAADGLQVVALGLDGVTIVAGSGGVLVAATDRLDSLKGVVELLPAVAVDAVTD
ncbi:MAG: mannose-1-phosphate guanylyltransferase/mannose-6-phosphate isomerase [Hyphomicrobiales bacterium]|nr:MAG: mannose-1-phosphate guanylyltransferase/mannose-6-phosphate isomerase [Hyphomicrobiales bacterium]